MEFSDAEIEFFNDDKTVILAVLQNDTPIGIPIWGLLYNNAVYMATESNSLKLKLIDKHNEVSATVMKSPPGYPWMRIEGTAEIGDISEFPEFSNFRDAVDRIATNYVGEEEAPKRFEGENWTIIKINPNKVVGNIEKK